MSRLHIHRWQIIADTGAYAYSECRSCGNRKAERVENYLQPTNGRWLEHKTDDFREVIPPPPKPIPPSGSRGWSS